MVTFSNNAFKRMPPMNYFEKALLGLVSIGPFILQSSIAFSADESLKLRPSLQWYSYLEYRLLSDSQLNTDNSVAKIPDRLLINDFRPQMKVLGPRFTLVARPLLKHEIASSKIGEKRSSEKPHASSRWVDAFGVWEASDLVQLSYGLQTYQWGAAESINPSNKIFHESIDSKGLLYASNGRTLARANLTWSKQLSTVLIAETDEPEEKNRTIYRSDEEWQSKSLIKNEISWNDGSDYIGFVLGSLEVDGPWIGEYLNINLFEGLSIYADASHERGSKAWYPVKKVETLAPGIQSTVIKLEQEKIDETKTHTLATSGLRYSFEGGSDFRLEGIYNSAGWSKEQYELGLQSLDRTNPSQLNFLQDNAKRYLKPGLDFRGQRYLLCSFRTPDVFDIKDFVWYVRNLRSLTDQSAQYYSSVEYAFTSFTLLASYAHSVGKTDSELVGFVRRSGLLGIRQDF